MRNVAVFAFLLIAGVAQAQETYSIAAGATNVTTLTGVITAKNGDKCAKVSLPRTCTQAQLCTAKGVTGGASCTAAQARSAGERIYPLTQAGRDEFVTFEVALPKFTELVSEVQTDQRRDFCEKWNAATQTARNNACTAIGATSGCGDSLCSLQ